MEIMRLAHESRSVVEEILFASDRKAVAVLCDSAGKILSTYYHEWMRMVMSPQVDHVCASSAFKLQSALYEAYRKFRERYEDSPEEALAELRKDLVPVPELQAEYRRLAREALDGIRSNL